MNEEDHKCRYFPRKFPSVDEVVMVRISQITDVGVYCQLLEYGNTPGLIIVGELSKKKFVNVHSLVKINKVEAATVLRVDEIKGYVDLSRKKVTQEEFTKCLKRYSCAKLCHNVLVFAAKRLDKDVSDLYEQFAYKKHEQHGSLYSFFTKIFTNTLDKNEIKSYDANETLIFEAICEGLKKKFNVTKYKIKAEVDVHTLDIHGVKTIKKCFKACKELNPKIQITLIKPPTYSISLITSDKEGGLRFLHNACKIVKENIEKCGGNFAQITDPVVFGDKGNLETLCAKADELYDNLLQEELSDSSSSNSNNE